MLTINSPKFLTSKTEITKNSPTFRCKRAPSVQDHFTTDTVPRVTAQSPAKLSEDRKRRSHHENVMSSLIVKPTSRDKGNKEIYDSIHQLKQQYKSLKEAYRVLIQQKLKNTHQISQIRSENNDLLKQNERISRQNERLRMQLGFLQQENDRTRRQCYKLLEVQKFKAQKLEESLCQKQQYINQTLLKIRTQADQTTLCIPRNASLIQIPQEDVSLTISQDKSALIDRSFNNQSQFLSFSLTSVLEQSTDKQLTQSKRKIEHVKAVSELNPRLGQDERKNRQFPPNFKKVKRQIPKLELNSIESKASLLNNLQLKGREKRGSKGRASKSFREKQNKETLNQNGKKKSKKLINLSGIAQI